MLQTYKPCKSGKKNFQNACDPVKPNAEMTFIIHTVKGCFPLKRIYCRVLSIASSQERERKREVQRETPRERQTETERQGKRKRDMGRREMWGGRERRKEGG